MELLGLIASILAVDFVANLAPGPNQLVVMRYALHSRRDAFGVVIGLIIANGLLYLGSILLGTAVGQLPPTVTLIVKFGAVFYLFYVGIRCLLPLRNVDTATQSAQPPSGNPVLSGLIVCLANPRAALYFTALGVMVLSTTPPVWALVAIFFCILCSVAASLGLIAFICSDTKVRPMLIKYERLLDIVMGCVFVISGVLLLVF